MKLCEFLFDELHQHGVRHIFGIPGDFVLNLYEALSSFGKFQLVTLSHEPAVGFAADASARISNGLGVCCVTYGAGGLNMINSVACAYAEKSPLVIISGGPGKEEKDSGILVHHQVKTFETQLKIFQEVVEYGAVLDNPQTAGSQIRLAITIALKFSRPVYLEVPRDMVFAEIENPGTLEETGHKVNRGALEEAGQEIIERLTASQQPVLVVGLDAHRLRLQDSILRLAEKLKVPVVSSFLGRGVFPGRHPQFVGTYLGIVSPDPLRKIVEGSDCLLMLGVEMTDTSLGIPPDSIKSSNTIFCSSQEVRCRNHVYQNVPLDRLVTRILDSSRLAVMKHSLPDWKSGISPEVLEPFQTGEPIRVKHLIQVLNDFLALHPEMPVVCDTGDCLFASVDVRSDSCVAPAHYGTMGFAVPAAIGLQVTSNRRPLVLVGDGAFQMTGCEIAQAVKYNLNPIIVLFNNSRWEMLQVFSPLAKYNETVSWPFAELAKLWGGSGYEARTPGRFRESLAAAWEESRFALISVQLQKGDVSPILRGFVDAFKRKVYK